MGSSGLQSQRCSSKFEAVDSQFRVKVDSGTWILYPSGYSGEGYLTESVCSIRNCSEAKTMILFHGYGKQAEKCSSQRTSYLISLKG